MSRVLSTRPCHDCGELTERDIRKKRCVRCQRKAKVAQTMKYRATPKGRAALERQRQSPQWKLYRARWVAAHPEKVAEYNARAYSRRRRSGYVIACATLWCQGTFVRTQHNSRRLFCDECRILHGYTSPHAVGWERRRTRQARAA